MSGFSEASLAEQIFQLEHQILRLRNELLGYVPNSRLTTDEDPAMPAAQRGRY